MRTIGSLGDEKQLETFIAYLVTQKIPVHVDRESSPPTIWIKNEDQVAAAQEHFQKFLANPADSEYANVLEQAGEILRSEARRRAETRKLVKNYASQMRLGPTYRAPLTVALTTLCVVLWILQTFALNPNGPKANAIERMFGSSLYRTLAFAAISPAALNELNDRDIDDFRVRAFNLLRGELWRLVTPIFIHFGAWHIALNLISFWQLGRVLENRYGTWKLAIVILLIAVISNFLQGVMPVRWDGSPIAGSASLASRQSEMPVRLDGSPIAGFPDGWGLSVFGGISGVVFGLLGFAWVKSRFDWKSGFYIPRATMIWAIAWIFLGISPLDRQLLGADMANWAHGVGFLVGVALGYLSVYHNSPIRPKK